VGLHLEPLAGEDPALAVSGLCFSYPDNPDVLGGVSLEVMPGERVGLIGANGAGKTTFFLAVCGVLKPRAGEIVLFGEPMRPGDFRPEIGMVFQNPDDQLFCPSVWEDVAFGPQNMGLSNDEVAARVKEALTVTGVLDLADRPPHHLSGGEKRMVSIAGVLAMHPRLVVYDEPNANLDIRSRRRLIRFLQTARAAQLIASHDLELILEVCSRVILLDEGRIVADGEPRELMGDVALMEAHGLERPHSLVPHAEPHHRFLERESAGAEEEQAESVDVRSGWR
jgi:cobalt/nickel transport system ATP-binding protein